MNSGQQTLLNWRRLPVSEQQGAGLPLASGLNCDQTFLGPEPSHLCHQLVPSIEEENLSSLGSNVLNMHDNNVYKSENSSVDNTYRRIRNDTIRPSSPSSEPEEHPYDDRDTAPDLQDTEISKKRPIVVELPQSTLTQPRSLFRNFIPPVTEIREADAIAILLGGANTRRSSQEEHIEFDLHDFSIYLDSELYRYELRPLHHLATRITADHFFFDGTISQDGKQYYLRRVPFRQLPIGNYGSEEHSVDDQIWIRSELNEAKQDEIYYKLKNPSTEYARFYHPFLWIVDLAKHVLDYCNHLKENGRRAELYDFKSRFSIWAQQKHNTSTAFRRWYSANRTRDFRAAIITNIEFIWKEAYGLDPTTISCHTIWDEVRTLDRFKPNLATAQLMPNGGGDVNRYQPTNRKDGPVPPTIVTPYVYDLFSHMVFGGVLERVKPSTAIERKRQDFLRKCRPIEQWSTPTIKRDSCDREAFMASIEVGDVISTKPDDENTDTEWKQEKSRHYEGEHLWFGLVQKIHQWSRGKRSFDVIWLYQPIDTPCGVMKYPFNNELFLSNNCTCHHGTAKVQAHQILSTHDVEWFGDPSTTAEFFVRQTYLSDDCRWTTLRREHLTCEEDKFHKRPSYKVGDAVLVETDPKALRLENFIVEAFFDDDNRRYVRLRRLLRRRDVDRDAPHAPPNEVVYTNRFVEISTRRIFRHCLVRGFRSGEEIPSPYNHNGTGDLFFMTHQEVETGEGEAVYVPLDTSILRQLRQGFDPSQAYKSQKLQGLDLFCGGGNFGRGLEDGGAIEMSWANDIWREAIHTYMANCEPGTCTPFLGSVDDLLLHAIRGDDAKVPKPGDVQFISAGSPCPGFSLLTNDKTTNHQRKNQSLVASFASFVDVYRPYYGILENVPHMVNSKTFRDACVFSQLVCALVGLGYQTQVMFLDAWSFGAPQSRSRVFLCFSAPGFRMPKVPAPSHSHPPGTKLTKLGEMSCGRPFDKRVLMSTPFRYVSSSEATKDLPDIQDGKADFCVGFPDHHLSIGVTPPVRKQLFHIPTQPWGMNFSKAWHGRPGMPPVLSEADRHHLYPAEPTHRVMRPSKGWGRVHPKGLFGTIATACPMTDARMGTINHWYQHRPLSILEVRRAQGFRDHEVLVGLPIRQWRIVGNSVARQVSLALGLAVREAWYGTLFDEPHLPQAGLVSVTEKSASRTATSLYLSERPATKSVEEAREVDMGHVAGTDSSGVSTPSDGILLASTPPLKSLSLTPATSESNGFSDGETTAQKRPPTMYIEILAKRQRLGPSYVEAK